MTCVIGFIDAEKDCVWIGADSLGSNGYTKAVESQPKVFRNSTFKNVIMGSTSTFRHIDLLKYSETLFDEIDLYKNTDLNHKYMVTKFVPRIMTLFKDGLPSCDEKNRGANFIIGAGNHLFEIQEDYSVLQPELGFCAVGCGYAVAMGSLITSQTMYISPVERITLALEAAEKYCCGVQRPFRIINTKDEEEKIIT